MAYGASIDRPQAVNRPSTSKITKSHSKRVRFGSTNVIADVKLCQDPSEKDNLWWSTDRLRETHQAARDLGLEALRSCWMVKGFEEMFEAAQRAALRLADEASIHESFQTMAVSGEVVDWCRYGHSWRGLERFSSIRNNEARSDVIKSAKRAVLEDAKVQRRLSPTNFRTILTIIAYLCKVDRISRCRGDHFLVDFVELFP